MKRLIDRDLETGIETNFHWDDAEGTFTISSKQDVTGIVDTNKSSFSGIDERANWKGEWHHVASIPLTVYYELKRQGILDDQAAMKRWLNDRDNRYFRVRPGKV